MSKIATDISLGAGILKSSKSRGQTNDKVISWFIFLNGAVAVLAIILIFVFLIKDAAPFAKHTAMPKFLAGTSWLPEFEIFGIIPLMMGSLFVTLGALVIAVPMGVACAVYLAEIAPKWAREILKPTIEVLAGIPSVVIGFIGAMVLAPFLQQILNLPTGLSAMSASIMLAFMSLPTIISISEDAIVSVPKSYRQGSLALGASHWETIRNVIVPSAKSGIIAACMLGIGRAIGETMTVLMVAGNASNLPGGPGHWWTYFTSPVKTMTATIAADMGEIVQGSPHYHSLFAVGLVLFLITFAINLTADLALKRSRH